MKRRFVSTLLALVLCLGLALPASAAGEQQITVNGQTYEALLGAILSETEADSVTARLDTDVVLTAAVVIGTSDYDGLFAEPMTVTAKNVTVDLNGHTLTGAPGCAVFEVQEGYTLTIVDSSAGKTGKLAADAEEAVVVAEGAVYNALPAGEPEEAAPAAENPFPDVAEDSPYYDAILWAVEKGITQGYTDGSFRPAATCSHLHILTFLWRAEGKPDATGEASQETMDVTRWAIGEDLLQVDDIHAGCTRADAVTYLWKAVGAPEAKEAVSFTDVAADAAYAQAVAWAVENGVTLGTSDTTFSPDTICTRGQIATFLYRVENLPAGEAETTPA